MDTQGSNVNKDKKETTYKEHIKNRFDNTIVLAREMERTLGTETAHAIIKDAFYKEMKEIVREEMEAVGPITSFKDFVDLEKAENKSIDFKNIIAVSYPHESPTELSLHVSECLYADVFKELAATESGYLMVCNPDHAYAHTCHPRIKLRRSKTIMQGDSHCNHTWYWDEN